MLLGGFRFTQSLQAQTEIEMFLSYNLHAGA